MSSAKAASVANYVDSLKKSPRFGPQVVHHQFFPAQDASHQALAQPLSPAVQALVEQEAPQLYSHQAEAIDLIRQGEDIIVATATASGKSLIYNTPIIEALLADQQQHALYLFPLKALAQDQLRRLQELAQGLPAAQRFTAAVCDGDTNSYQRRKLRQQPANIMISNPDMLHHSLLAYHERWARLWQGLRYVVIDEVHSYRGVFGTHMAWVLRRLQRICALYGSQPQFLLFSATIGNPEQLAGQLLDRPVRAITASGAPTPPRHFMLFDPWDGAAWSACQMLEAAIKRGLRTIVYSQSRKMTELVALWTQEKLGEYQHRLAAYRAGFLPEQRREIEQQLASGELLGVVSTSALELGIDIGSLDICILLGYPGSMMATWQRGGRVGRKLQESLVIMVAQEDALDQYFLRHPAQFLARPVERAVLNPANEVISQKQLICAAAESPLQASELAADQIMAQGVNRLLATGELLQSREGDLFFALRKQPQRQLELRGTGHGFTILRQDNKQSLGEIDGARVYKECHPGALYLHQGQSWQVVDLDLQGRLVWVRRKEADYFTRAMASKETEVLQTLRQQQAFAIKAGLGRLKVTEQVSGYQRKLIRGQQLIGRHSLDLPPQIFETEGLWFEVPAQLEQALQQQQAHFMGGIHAVEHAVIGVMPLMVLCDRNDIGGISYPFHPQLNGPAIFIYDGYPGGVGLCAEAFSRLVSLLRTALQVIRDCDCEAGCPSCVHSPKCGSGNRPIDKAAAQLVLEGLLSGEENFAQVSLERPAVNQPVASGAELPRRWAVFDLETQRSAAEVGGWHRADKMGVSVALVYDGENERYLTYTEQQVAELIHFLEQQQLIIGFNNKRFDNKVLSGYANHQLHKVPTVDLLEEVKAQLGYRLSLDRLAEQTLGSQKSGDGLQALKWYQQGEIAKIISYCRQDVEMTKDLFLFARERGYLLFRNKAGHTVRCPMPLNLAKLQGERG